MSLTMEQLDSAVQEARQTIRNGDIVARRLASIVAGRLRMSDVDIWVLKELKRELRDFNIHTGTWKDKK